MELYILLVLALIIVLLFFISRCNLGCPCGKDEKYLHPPLPFNEHPSLIKRRRYQPTLASESGAPRSGSLDVNYKYKCITENGSQTCKCIQCDATSSKCTSKNCGNEGAVMTCCTTGSCSGCTDDDCTYNDWCGSDDGGGGSGDGDNGDNSDKIWFIVGISVLVAAAFGIFFYYWMTTKSN
uniref:Uncharacterized protein n=1 Tax=Marseillevirus LCMAC101 TaxID=2506602 RepID=A0A481YSZ3_9VIRU|nr:MAG: hypothetical protein LCMAC101_02010 [Marseillevirus LCMAC101]